MITEAVPKLLYGWGIVDANGGVWYARMIRPFVGSRSDLEPYVALQNEIHANEPGFPLRLVPLYYSEIG